MTFPSYPKTVIPFLGKYLDRCLNYDAMPGVKIFRFFLYGKIGTVHTVFSYAQG
jgi:hypothetical protein